MVVRNRLELLGLARRLQIALAARGPSRRLIVLDEAPPDRFRQARLLERFVRLVRDEVGLEALGRHVVGRM